MRILTVTLKQQYKNLHKLQFNNWMNSPYIMVRSHQYPDSVQYKSMSKI